MALSNVVKSTLLGKTIDGTEVTALTLLVGDPNLDMVGLGTEYELEIWVAIIEGLLAREVRLEAIAEVEATSF